MGGQFRQAMCPCWGLHARPCQGVNRQQEENEIAQ